MKLNEITCALGEKYNREHIFDDWMERPTGNEKNYIFYLSILLLNYNYQFCMA